MSILAERDNLENEDFEQLWYTAEELGHVQMGDKWPAGGVGLSTSHISPIDHTLKEKKPYVEFWYGGSKIKVHNGMSANRQAGGGVRGLATFSQNSRRRLMRKIAEMKRGNRPVFVTLTYPKEYSENYQDWKRDLDTFGKRFMRRFPKGAYIWKLEFQKRGAPHYHLLVWGVKYADLLEWVSSNWFHTVGSNDQKHLLAGTRVEKIRSYKGVMAYASKYMTKEENKAGVGRFWGVIGRSNLPVARMMRLNLSREETQILIRLMKRYAGLSKNYYCLTVFCNASFWFDRLEDILYPP
jgi:hypothetical protein